MRILVTFLTLNFFVAFPGYSKKPLKDVRPDQKRVLVDYLKTHWTTPEEYVVEKFRDHDIVFVGEMHRIKHDPVLIQNLIPRLYKAGVRNLGIEFTCYEDQEKADRLVTGERYDAELARWLFRRYFSTWGYVEYMDIYRRAWELNRSLPADAPKFRVVNLMYRPAWNEWQDESDDKQRGRVWHKGNPDEFMAQVILSEFVQKAQKALIYSGSHHAFTRYLQPVYDFEKKKFYRFEDTRMGNVVYRKIPTKVFNIFLHSPWVTRESSDEHNYPVGGVIDRVMREFKNKSVGFDVKHSPFGDLRDPDTYYSVGYEDFKLGTFCDGYIYQRPFSEYEGCTVDPNYVTQENLQEAIQEAGGPRARKLLKLPADFLRSMKEDADMKRRFADLE
jgi:hypothetical protein